MTLGCGGRESSDIGTRSAVRYVARMTFDVDADAYDAFMGGYSVLLAPQLAGLAGVTSGQRALDVGCGTRTLTDESVDRLDASSVSAVDPSAPFVASVRDRYPRSTCSKRKPSCFRSRPARSTWPQCALECRSERIRASWDGARRGRCSAPPWLHCFSEAPRLSSAGGAEPSRWSG
jgi:hypothetical protein